MRKVDRSLRAVMPSLAPVSQLLWTRTERDCVQSIFIFIVIIVIIFIVIIIIIIVQTVLRRWNSSKMTYFLKHASSGDRLWALTSGWLDRTKTKIG